ncbi:hypothetical protein FH972_027376 [Carpinus fangiana]|uniref:Uncharacterized protein n=1 Tax=Carpinus fangiana TaxID=176857 RepID=A0A5N6Q7H5_9ROSI|nr:hypothetical protein FH972_027376 [Carpinus fangiana]
MDRDARRGLRKAVDLMHMVIVHFKREENVVKRFIAIMQIHRKGRTDMNEVCEEVANLFVGHQDLTCWIGSSSL